MVGIAEPGIDFREFCLCGNINAQIPGALTVSHTTGTGTDEEGNVVPELLTFEQYMTPVYSQFNDTTYVVYELTDYIDQIRKNATNRNTITVACYDYALNTATYDAVSALRQADREATAAGNTLAVAIAFRDKVVPAMAALRASVDEMETLMASEDWPLPTYGEIMHKQ